MISARTPWSGAPWRRTSRSTRAAARLASPSPTGGQAAALNILVLACRGEGPGGLGGRPADLPERLRGGDPDAPVLVLQGRRQGRGGGLGLRPDLGQAVGGPGADRRVRAL